MIQLFLFFFFAIREVPIVNNTELYLLCIAVSNLHYHLLHVRATHVFQYFHMISNKVALILKCQKHNFFCIIASIMKQFKYLNVMAK